VPVWDAEVEIDEKLVRGLLAEQFPEFEAGSARLIGEGWDNSVWLVEERWAFRFPRREIAIPGVERELIVLPLLAPLLPVAIPEPRFVGVPGHRFPWPFFGARLLAGQEPAEAGHSDDARAELGGGLGRFLRSLHSPATLEAVDPDARLPVDPNRRADMEIRVERAREQLAALGRSTEPAVVELLAAASGLPHSHELALCHGDLHLRHVLVDRASLTGVIDWGDVCRADPAIDLVLYWSLLSPVGREAFLAEYGPVPGERLLRARVLSLFLCAILVLYARDVGHARLEREALAGLDRTLAD
jgi:aminoglycoside phosphotransferase (APT) family kinase protein